MLHFIAALRAADYFISAFIAAAPFITLYVCYCCFAAFLITSSLFQIRCFIFHAAAFAAFIARDALFHYAYYCLPPTLMLIMPLLLSLRRFIRRRHYCRHTFISYAITPLPFLMLRALFFATPLAIADAPFAAAAYA